MLIILFPVGKTGGRVSDWSLWKAYCTRLEPPPLCEDASTGTQPKIFLGFLVKTGQVLGGCSLFDITQVYNFNPEHYA